MPDNKYNIEFFQGSTFSLNLTVKNANGSLKDLTAHSARMQIRPNYNSSAVTESLSTTNGEIIIDSSNSVISLELSATRTANIAVDLGSGASPPRTKYVYDLELSDPQSKVTKLLFGDVIVYGEVTR
jgi:hypothetical protein